MNESPSVNSRKFEPIISAIENAAKTELDLAFVIKDELGPAGPHGVKDGSRALLQELSEVIFKETGHQYTAARLGKLRSIATNFGWENIPPGAAIGVLEVARTPDRLATVIAAHPGKVLTRDLVSTHFADLLTESRAAKLREAKEAEISAQRVLATSHDDKARKEAETSLKNAGKVIDAAAKREPPPESNFNQAMRMMNKAIQNVADDFVEYSNPLTRDENISLRDHLVTRLQEIIDIVNKETFEEEVAA